MTGEILFKVISEGREYVIYDDGRVEGFGEHPKIINYHHLLAAEFHLRQTRRQLEKPSPLSERCTEQADSSL